MSRGLLERPPDVAPPAPPAPIRATGADDAGLILPVALWLGMLSGWAEVAFLTVRTLWQHRLGFEGPDVIWMAPLANMVLLGAVAGPVYLLARRWPRLGDLRVTVTLFGFLASMSFLLLFSQLDHRAAILLAAGVSVAGARTIAAHRTLCARLLARLPRLSRRRPAPAPMAPPADPVGPSRREFLVGAAATVGGLALGTQGWQALVDRYAAAPRVAGNAAELPNVLFIVLDTVRAQNVGFHGYDRSTTPQLDRLVARGVHFRHAFAPAPWTLPSHASMFTGRWPHELSADWLTALDGKFPTLAEVLGAHGYATAGFMANGIYGGREWGLGRGFAHYEDHPLGVGQVALSSALGRTLSNSAGLREAVGYHDVLDRKRAPDVANDLLRWLSRHDGRPFFAFLNYFDAHEPCLPPPPFDRAFGPGGPRTFKYNTQGILRADAWKMRPDEVRVERDAYDGAIAYLDHSLGVLFDDLERRGVLDNTLVIIASDHGEEFGEHGVFSHGHSLYLPALHVPLMISLPSRIPRGVAITEPVSLRDLPSTILDVVGIRSPHPFPGSSLAQHWGGAPVGAGADDAAIIAEVGMSRGGLDWYPAALGPMKSLITPHYHYIVRADGHEELYAYVDDPWESADLASSGRGQAVIERLKGSLHAATLGSPGHRL